MTTTATEDKGKVALPESNGSAAPKRRGRPPGSKNKPKDGAPAKTRRRAAVPAKAATPTRTAAPKVHAVLVSNDGIEVLHADGSSERFPVSLTGAPLFDRRK